MTKQITIKMPPNSFSKAELGCEDFPLACRSMCSSQTQVGLPNLCFASNLDVPKIAL